MSLADHIPVDRRSIGSSRIVNILWLTGLAFVAGIFLMVLLQRLGAPLVVALGIVLVFSLVGVVTLSWIGRTMTSSLYFFAGRLAGVAPNGLGSTTDWISGAFLMTFFALPLSGKLVLAPAVMLAILMQATLFANVFHRSSVSSPPGFLGWRYQNRFTGPVALAVTCSILVLLIFAEFEVARLLLATITDLPLERAGLIVAVLVALPALFGGWLALMIVNSVLALWMLIAVLSPAIATGFFPDFLRTGLELGRSTQTFAPLNFNEVDLFGLTTGGGISTFTAVTTMLVLAAGFSVMPHTLSRIALLSRPVATIESLGWCALGGFLLFSALPLSIGLIGTDPASDELAALLKSQPVLHMMPYIALLFAAFNALSATLFAFSSAIVRALRRTARLDPGEQSIFSTRFLACLCAFGLVYVSQGQNLNASKLLILAVSLSAATLFMPMVAAAWISSLPRWAALLAMLTGALAFGIFSGAQFPGSDFLNTSGLVASKLAPLQAGALGMIANLAVLVAARGFSIISKNTPSDSSLALIRRVDQIS